MKIIISESQVNLLKESSIIDMDTQELYNRSLKLKNSILKSVESELEDYDWFNGLTIEIMKDWNGIPILNFIIKSNKSLSRVETLDPIQTEQIDEINDKIGYIFNQYFPQVNKHTKFKVTGDYAAFIQDDNHYVIHV
jgi:hypothetical protein